MNIKKSSFGIGDSARITKNHKRFLSGDIVTVIDNIKRGSLYTIRVEDRVRGIVGRVPRKYLEEI